MTSTLGSDGFIPETYQNNASFVYSPAFANPVLDLLNAQAGEKILDLGCGTGEITFGLVEIVAGNEGEEGKGEGKIIALDSSKEMIESAQELCTDKLLDSNVIRGIREKPRLEFCVGDGQKLEELIFEERGKLDAVFSKAAIHWMNKDPVNVVKGCYDILKRGGRFVGEVGGFLNMIGVRAALHAALRSQGYDPTAVDPFYYPTAVAYRAILEKQGFRVESCELVPRITPLATGLEGWLNTFAFSFLNHLPAETRSAVIAEVCDKMAIDMKDEMGNWTCMYVRLRFRAIKD